MAAGAGLAVIPCNTAHLWFDEIQQTLGLPMQHLVDAVLEDAVQVLKRRGAAAVVLGCTEIPLVLDADNAPLPVIDATAALARRAVAWSLAQ